LGSFFEVVEARSSQRSEKKNAIIRVLVSDLQLLISNLHIIIGTRGMGALPPDRYQTTIETKPQTIKEIHMSKTVLSIVFFLCFAVLAGMSATSFAAQSVGGEIDDTVITTTVKAELAKDVRLGTLTGIEVNTTQGVVTLAGKVHNSEEKSLVEQKVRTIKGVVKVNNALQIVTP